jgi:hypothetical protein
MPADEWFEANRAKWDDRTPWLVEDGEGRWWPPPDRPRIPLSFTLLASR